MGDILSQADIDLLTKSLLGGGDAAAPAATATAAPTPVENIAEVARPFFKVLCEQASSVVTTVLSRAVDFQLQWLVAGENSVIPDELKSQSLYICVEVKKTVVGKMYFAISKPEVATLSDLMLMGSGHSDYTDEHKDAICEIINQITGSCITVMDSQLHLAMDFGQASVSEFSGTNDGFKGGSVATVLVKIEEFPDRKILIFLDENLFSAIRSKISSKMAYATADTSLASLGLSSSVAAPVPAAGGNIPTGGGGGAPVAAPPALMPHHSGGPFGSTGNKALDLLMDIELPIVIELGRTQMSLKRILELGPGAIVEMDRLAGEPVDILINGKVVARGEVVVVDENFGVRILALVSPEERLKLLR
ncbi:MAG: flagellar motor switch protein FliN [Fibromonadaceae bacterium]|jgi:flagellar motor switch protein FliN/FliY|nr:flagellar motor switch protein FliN [Fibromonadaceae bacterium]